MKPMSKSAALRTARLLRDARSTNTWVVLASGDVVHYSHFPHGGAGHYQVDAQGLSGVLTTDAEYIRQGFNEFHGI